PVSNGLATSAPASVIITAIPGILVCGDVISGSISAAGQVNQYHFAGTANGILTLTLARTGGFGSSFAFAGVFAPSGKSVVGFNANGQQQLTLTERSEERRVGKDSNFPDAAQYNLGQEYRAVERQPRTTIL